MQCEKLDGREKVAAVFMQAFKIHDAMQVICKEIDRQELQHFMTLEDGLALNKFLAKEISDRITMFENLIRK